MSDTEWSGPSNAISNTARVVYCQRLPDGRYGVDCVPKADTTSFPLLDGVTESGLEKTRECADAQMNRSSL